MEACLQAVGFAVKGVAVAVFETVRNEMTEHRALISHLFKLATKSIIRVALLSTIVVMDYGMEIISTALLTDLVQYVLEAACAGVKPYVYIFQWLPTMPGDTELNNSGYKEAGNLVGRGGNIVIEVVVGVMFTGSVWALGFVVGAIVGFVIWVIGQIVGQLLISALS